MSSGNSVISSPMDDDVDAEAGEFDGSIQGFTYRSFVELQQSYTRTLSNFAMNVQLAHAPETAFAPHHWPPPFGNQFPPPPPTPSFPLHRTPGYVPQANPVVGISDRTLGLQNPFRYSSQIGQISPVHLQTVSQWPWAQYSANLFGNHLPPPPLPLPVFVQSNHPTPQNSDSTLDADEVDSQYYSQLAQQAAAPAQHSALALPEIQALRFGIQMPPPVSPLPQSPPQPPLFRLPPAMPPVPPSTPVHLTDAQTLRSTQNVDQQLGLVPNLLPSSPPVISQPEPDDEAPSNEARPDSSTSCYIVSPPSQRSADSSSGRMIESSSVAQEQIQFNHYLAGSFQYPVTRESYQTIPMTTATYTPALGNGQPSTYRSFQLLPASFSEASTSRCVPPTTATSFERASESSARGSRKRRRVGRLEPRPKRSYEPPETRANLPLSRSSERFPSRSLESDTAPYSGHSFGPSTSGFVPPTASASGRATSSSLRQATTSRSANSTNRPDIPRPLTTPSLRLNTESRNEPRASSAFEPRLPGRSSEPPPAHVAIPWPIPDHSPMPIPAFTPRSPFLPQPPHPLDRVTILLPLVNTSAHTPVYSQAHIPMPVQRAAPPLEQRNLSHPEHIPMPLQRAAPPLEQRNLSHPEHIPMAPRSNLRETTGCPNCGNTHTVQNCPLRANNVRIRRYRRN